MTTIIENNINLDIIFSVNDIDHLILKNNLYNDNIELNVSAIGKLEIINIKKYYTNVFNLIIDRVKNGGELILRNVVLYRLDCSRFDRVKLIGCIILDIIEGECKVEYECKRYMSMNVLYCEYENDKGIYNGIVCSENNRIIKYRIGTMKYKIGSVYEGGWNDDERSGYGIMKYADSSMYEGKWIDNVRNGYGIMKYADGSVYEGEWNDGSRSGYGIMKYADGSVYEGKWDNNVRTDYCAMTYADGSVYEY